MAILDWLVAFILSDLFDTLIGAIMSLFGGGGVA